jgi:hypothetical protein
MTDQRQNRFEDLRDDFLQQCYFRMKQIEREWKIEQDDATDDEVRSAIKFGDVELTILRIMFCHQLILTSRLKAAMIASVQNLPHVAGHMSRLTESSQTTPSASYLIKPEQLS